MAAPRTEQPQQRFRLELRTPLSLLVSSSLSALVVPRREAGLASMVHAHTPHPSPLEIVQHAHTFPRFHWPLLPSRSGFGTQ
eukprot:m.58461 g.58461  ORF g.58461 m.58461 type:complete len:82 (+) comp15906_c0_seq1:1637-1882(+)